MGRGMTGLRAILLERRIKGDAWGLVSANWALNLEQFARKCSFKAYSLFVKTATSMHYSSKYWHPHSASQSYSYSLHPCESTRP